MRRWFLLGTLLLFAFSAHARSLYWSSVVVDARLDRDGVLASRIDGLAAIAHALGDRVASLPLRDGAGLDSWQSGRGERIGRPYISAARRRSG